MMMIEENIPRNTIVLNVKFIILFRVWSLSLSKRFINFSFCIDVLQKCESVFHYFLGTQMAD